MALEIRRQKVSDAKRLKALEEENAKLKKLLTESMLDVSTLREMLERTSEAQFEEIAVNWALTEKGYSQRRACALVGIDPRVFRYRSTRSADAALRRRLRELSSERQQIGYRRLHILLRCEGWEVNGKRLYRIYCEERLTMRRRGGRKRALGTRAPMAVPQDPNQRWSLDFVSDALACGRRFRMLNLSDAFRRECLAIRIDRKLRSKDVIDVLSGLSILRGCPATSGSTTSYVGKKLPLEASDHGASERPDAMKMVAQTGSAVKKWSLP